MSVRLSCLVLTFSTLFFLSTTLASATTTTHTYDELDRLVQTVYDTGSKITTIDYTYDAAGNILNFSVTANFVLGDVDDSKIVDLTDAVLCQQVATGIAPSYPLYLGADVDGDGRLGTEELIYVLRKTAGLR